MTRQRTNIVLEMDYVRRIQERYHLRTKTEAVDLALRQAALVPMSLEEALAMEGSNSIGEVPADVPPRGVE